VIWTPEPKLGSASVATARGYDRQVRTVADQFVTATGKPLESVPLVMLAASESGARQGQDLYNERQTRGWDVKDTAVRAITAD
ncbi:arabinose ABC transporter substrate-binding protein, partial [Klebsiella pneumoniae]|nr:arabinose ABC transporter substrate-binding protein [Klebsiella pneumoniae]